MSKSKRKRNLISEVRKTVERSDPSVWDQEYVVSKPDSGSQNWWTTTTVPVKWDENTTFNVPGILKKINQIMDDDGNVHRETTYTDGTTNTVVGEINSQPVSVSSDSSNANKTDSYVYQPNYSSSGIRYKKDDIDRIKEYFNEFTKIAKADSESSDDEDIPAMHKWMAAVSKMLST